MVLTVKCVRYRKSRTKRWAEQAIYKSSGNEDDVITLNRHT